ncbi:MAG: holo-ACP synthase [Acidobacteria bacterium]|nr:holo-ACP synthase [Acidobacteriota bacterium]
MILGVGIDLVAVDRVERLLARHGSRFLDRCFVDGEAVRPGDAEHLAGLLAAKEAAFKALGTGWDAGVGWRSVAVTRPGGGAPALELSGAAAVRARDLGVRRSHLSISHDAGLAVAVVVLES